MSASRSGRTSICFIFAATLVGGGFRINTKDNWFPSIMKSTVDGAPVYVGSSSIYYEDESLYEHFSVSETGVYAVTVDLTDFKAIKVDIVKK